MPRSVLAFAAAATLLLNGSMASATLPAPSRCGNVEAVCVIALRMMERPPARPVDLMAQHTAPQARITLASASR